MTRAFLQEESGQYFQEGRGRGVEHPVKLSCKRSLNVRNGTSGRLRDQKKEFLQSQRRGKGGGEMSLHEKGAVSSTDGYALLGVFGQARRWPKILQGFHPNGYRRPEKGGRALKKKEKRRKKIWSSEKTPGEFTSAKSYDRSQSTCQRKEEGERDGPYREKSTSAGPVICNALRSGGP